MTIASKNWITRKDRRQTKEWVCITNSPSYFRYLNKQDHEKLLFWASQLLLILEGFTPQLNDAVLAVFYVFLQLDAL